MKIFQNDFQSFQLFGISETFPTYLCQYSSPLTTTCTYYLCLFSGWLALWPSWLWPPAERGKKEQARWGIFTSLWDHHYKGLSEWKIWMKGDFKISWFGASSLISILCLSSDTLRKNSLDINSKNRTRKHSLLQALTVNNFLTPSKAKSKHVLIQREHH